MKTLNYSSVRDVESQKNMLKYLISDTYPRGELGGVGNFPVLGLKRVIFHTSKGNLFFLPKFISSTGLLKIAIVFFFVIKRFLLYSLFVSAARISLPRFPE